MFSAYHAKLNAYIKVMLNNLISLDESINAGAKGNQLYSLFYKYLFLVKSS